MTDSDSTIPTLGVIEHDYLRCRVDGTTLVFVGEADMMTMDTITASVDEAPSAGDLTFDLSGVTFMDSSGLRALLDARSRLVAEGRRILIEGCSRPVERLLEITGVRDLF